MESVSIPLSLPPVKDEICFNQGSLKGEINSLFDHCVTRGTVVHFPRGAWHLDILVHICVNIGFQNTPKQVVAISKKTPLNKDFVLFDIRFDLLNLPDF